MELLCNVPAHTSVPDMYVLPPEKRAGLQLDVDSVSIPVIDLHCAALAREDSLRLRVAAEIVRAGKEFGSFQVVNHDVREDVLRGFRDAAAEFFAMPAEEKLPYCSDDERKPFRLASSTPYDRRKTRYWRDYFELRCHPVSDEIFRHCPAEPASFRPRLTEFFTAVHELAQTLLRLVAEGLGLSADFFAGDLSGGKPRTCVNYYPACPDPSLTLGLLSHCDRGLLTVLWQCDVAGLQARHNGRWLLVPPVPCAFLVIFGHQMEVVTNGVLASMEHRAITNSATARMSVATFIMPKTECRIGPAPEMVVEATNPAKFREFVCSDFMEAYRTAAASREDVLEYFKIHHD